MNAGIEDGDLVRLARDGDPVAFRLLVERHRPAARTRAQSLCANPSDVDDVVQESFLQALTGLDRLRDPDRFAGWLAGIVLNVSRRLHRRVPVTLLADWPEPLHPVSADGLPSAEDLDRADAMRAAVAGLPAGQRRAVALHYYADLPAGQIAEPAGAARASLHKARLRLRTYITEHRPDLVPVAARKVPMTTVRIARPQRRIPPGPVPIGFPTHVVMLTDDSGHRELPIWLRDFDPLRLSRLFERPAAAAGSERVGPPAAGSGRAGDAGDAPAQTVDELTARLLAAAGARVSGVDIDELGPDVTAARIELAGPAGARHITVGLAEGLALAITAGAPVRVADPVLDRLAVPRPDNDRPVPLPEPTSALAALGYADRPRYEPRNLAFADGLDGWRLGGTFTGHSSHSHWQDYAVAVAGGIAVLSATVPRPAGFAFLAQEIFADDYHGDVVTFRGELRRHDAAGSGAETGTASRAGLFLRGVRGPDIRLPLTERAAVDDPGNHIATVPAGREWTTCQVTAPIAADGNTIAFGIFLAGGGRIELRHARLDRDA